MGIILAILLFSFIILFHELGHFLAAKKQGIQVFEFSLGLGPTLLSKEYRGTKYCLKALPFGGSCMMGEDEGDSEFQGNFQEKSVWGRMLVIGAGPLFNFILAVILAVVLVGLAGYDKPVVQSVEEGYPAAEAGIRAGDTILKMGDKRIHLYREIPIYNRFHQGEKVTVTYLQNGEKKQAQLTPKMDDKAGYYRIGIGGGTTQKANLRTMLQYGWYEVKFSVSNTLESLKMLFTGKLSVKELSGPVGIVNMVDNTYQQSKSYGVKIVAAQLLSLAVLLSANLGVMNLLPLPALDGGRLVFLILEAIRGKRIAPEKEGYVHLVGIILLLGLMIFVLFQDLYRIFF